MSRSKVLIICPKFFPTKDGLSAHTFLLAKKLTKVTDTSLLTSKNNQYKSTDQINVLARIDKWSLKNLLKEYSYIKSQNFNKIIIQYVPTLYGKRGGINLTLPFFFLLLRLLLKAEIIIFYHELYYPLSLSLKPIILNLSHKFMLLISLLSTNKALFSTQRFKREARYFNLFFTKMFHCPIPLILNVNEENMTSTQDTASKIRFSIFGGAHPSKRYDLIFKALSNLKFPYTLNIIGPPQEKIGNIENFNLIQDSCIFHSEVSDSEAFNVLTQSDYSIGYFIDGITTRRSSMIASLAAGTPIITTRSLDSEVCFKNQSTVILFDIEDSLFINEFTEFTFKKKEASISQEAKDFQKEYFNWESTLSILGVSKSDNYH